MLRVYVELQSRLWLECLSTLSTRRLNSDPHDNNYKDEGDQDGNDDDNKDVDDQVDEGVGSSSL